MPILEVNKATKKFGGLIAVKSLDLIVHKGEIVGMIGPNGAGKTTAFNVISGFYKPEEGSVKFKDIEITKLRPDQICKLGLARTFQIVKPFPELNVLDNVTIGALNRTRHRGEAREMAFEILKFLNMAATADQLAGSLPIASRKRLEIAKALATQPQMILLDEVMAGLRPAEMEIIIETVRTISKRGVALLLVEHVMRVIMALADRVVVLHHGEKIADGTPTEIINNPEVISAYLGDMDDDTSD